MRILASKQLATYSLLVSASLWGFEARAASAPGDAWTGRAVLVGVPYFPGSLEPLEFADNDASNLRAALLLDSEHWRTENITLLVGYAGTAEAIRSAVRAMGIAAAPGDVCVFSYAGHGSQGRDSSPVDEADGLDEYLSTCTRWVRDDEIAEWFAAFECRNICIIIDSCYSGGATKSTLLAGYDAEDLAVGVAEDIGRATISVSETRTANDGSAAGMVLLAASSEAESSYTATYLENGIFTFFVAEALWQPQTDVDGDGIVSAEEIFAYAAPRTAEYSGRQTPVLLDLHEGELPLARAVARDYGSLEDAALGGGACNASPPDTRAGTGRGATIVILLVLAALALHGRLTRAIVASVLVIALSTGCAGSPVVGPSAPATPRPKRARGFPFVRAEIVLPLGERHAAYDPGVGVDVFMELGGDARRWEFGAGALFLKSREVDMTETILSARCDMLWHITSSSATRETYILTGARVFFGTLEARWGRARELAGSARLGFGWRRVASPLDIRVTIDAMVGSDNIKGFIGLSAGIGF
jgi:hypothetical protein